MHTRSRLLGALVASSLSVALALGGALPALGFDEMAETPVAEEAPVADESPEEGDEAYLEQTIGPITGEERLLETQDEGPSTQELLDGYVEQRFAQELPGAQLSTQSTATAIKGNDLRIYNHMSQLAIDVAAGRKTSTILTLSPADVAGQDSWTASELGTPLDGGSISDAAADAAIEKVKFNLSLVLNGILADHPYELYWFDKTATTTWSFENIRFIITGTGANQKLNMTANIYIKMPVSQDYAVSTYVVDASTGTRVENAVADAQSVVTQGATATSSYERMKMYKNAICSRVSYNDAAAAPGSAVPFGDPWQLVNVFDGDPNTKVVCEGYSKAFQYLCDLTGFADASCRTVSGLMSGGTGAGAHMWNIVNMDDGKNYLVDVTNCDEGTVGADDYLFVVGYQSIESRDIRRSDGTTTAWEGYVFDADGTPIWYGYNEDSRALWTTDELAVSNTAYDPSGQPVDKTPITSCTLSLAESQFTYDGTSHEPQVSASYQGQPLTLDTDFTVTYANNCNAGTGKATVTGKGDYSGSTTLDFSIAAREAMVYMEDSTKVYGSADPDFTTYLRTQGIVGSDEVEYNLPITRKAGENVGTYAVALTGDADQGNYHVTFVGAILTITAADISQATIASIPDQTYTGSALTPTLTVKWGETALVANTDFTVSYTSNTNAGTATATVTGKGNYTGSKSATFTISPASIAQATFATIPDQTYTGQALTPAVTVKLGDKTLASGTEYTLAYRDNVQVGTATVTATGKGNYTGSASTTFKIVEKPAERITFSDVRFENPGKTPHCDDIQWLADQGISKGWKQKDGTYQFRGGSNVVRQDMAAFLYRLAGSPDYEPSAADKRMFADVSERTPHAKEIWWLAKEGISTGWTDRGTGTRTFRPGSNVVRQDMAAFLRRLGAYMGVDTSLPAGYKNPFADVTSATPHREDVLWLASSGVSAGWTEKNGTKTFRGGNNVVRQDMAAFLHRLYNLA